MDNSTKRFGLNSQINDAIWNEDALENNKYAKLLELLKSTYPYFNEKSAGFYYLYFSQLIQNLETDEYLFENAVLYFNILVQRKNGENKDYWTCADFIRRNTLHGKEFFKDLKQTEVAYKLESMFVRDLDGRYEYENNSVKINAR